jgi:hypothetical protein
MKVTTWALSDAVALAFDVTFSVKVTFVVGKAPAGAVTVMMVPFVALGSNVRL